MCAAQVHCLVEHGAALERTDGGGTRDRTGGCQNPALVASLLKKASKTGTSAAPLPPFPSTPHGWAQASYSMLRLRI